MQRYGSTPRAGKLGDLRYEEKPLQEEEWNGVGIINLASSNKGCSSTEVTEAHLVHQKELANSRQPAQEIKLRRQAQAQAQAGEEPVLEILFTGRGF